MVPIWFALRRSWSCEEEGGKEGGREGRREGGEGL